MSCFRSQAWPPPVAWPCPRSQDPSLAHRNPDEVVAVRLHVATPLCVDLVVHATAWPSWTDTSRLILKGLPGACGPSMVNICHSITVLTLLLLSGPPGAARPTLAVILRSHITHKTTASTPARPRPQLANLPSAPSTACTYPPVKCRDSSSPNSDSSATTKVSANPLQSSAAPREESRIRTGEPRRPTTHPSLQSLTSRVRS